MLTWFWTVYLIGFGVVMVLLTLVWAASVRLVNASIVDPFWGLGFVLLAAYYFFNSAGDPSRKLIVLITLIEYGVLGLLAGLIGSAAAIILSWSVSKYALEITWSFTPSINFVGVALTLLLVTVIGVLSSWDVMIKKPLGILRAE